MGSVEKFGSAVILCGGKSSRMGFDKCNIAINQKPIYEVIGDKLAQIFDEVVLVTSSFDKVYSEKYRVVVDVFKECGPIGGIYTGLKNCKSEFVFFIGCDMPFVHEETIISFMDKLTKEGASYEGIVGINKGYIEPLYSFYSKALMNKINDKILEGDYQINKLIRINNIYLAQENEWSRGEGDVVEDEVNIYSNLNYIEDIELLKKL